MGQTEINIFLIISNVVILVFITGIIAFVLQYRKQVMKHQRELLEQEFATRTATLYQISRNLHDDIGAGLSGISLILQLATTDLQKGHLETVDESLRKINGYMADVIEKVSDISFLMQPKNESLAMLLRKLQEYAVNTCRAKQMQLVFEAEEKLDTLQLDLLKRRNIFLICKEGINNAVKYSGSHILEFYAVQNDLDITLTIVDKGHGYNTNEVFAGNGLPNMHVRAAEMKGQFSINSSLGIGTSLILSVPTST